MSFNERTGTDFHFLEINSDVVFQVLIWRLRYKLSLRDLAEMFLLRGFHFAHETVREWEERFGEQVGALTKAPAAAGRKRMADRRTYIGVRGKSVYLYRAIDGSGALVDVMLEERRDLAAATTFFRGAYAVAGRRPKQATTDGHRAYPRAIRETLGKRVGRIWRVSATGLRDFIEGRDQKRPEPDLKSDRGFD